MDSKKRLDQLVFEKGLTESREKAQRLILARKIKVNDQFITKVGTKVSENAKLELEKGFEYVGRGAKKIESAYKKFKIDFNGKTIVDIGASTGGFTDFALQHGAKKVYAVDTGYGQLAYSLRCNSQVINMERTDIRKVSEFSEKIDMFLIDVSFISLKRIFPKVAEFIDNQKTRSSIIALVKPQFEVGKEIADKTKGVIKDEKIQKRVLQEIKAFAKELGFTVISEVKAGVTGEKGNQEYLLYLTR